MQDYKEPEVTFAVLDFLKPKEARLCLESIQRFVKIPHKVVYLHNGFSEYAYDFYKERLVDTFIQTRLNGGLGVGTRDLMSVVFTPYTIMLQNDQVIGRPFEEQEFRSIAEAIDREMDVSPTEKLKSVSLAGPTAGKNIYSERCHMIRTDFYRLMEFSIPLGTYGAGPYHHGDWREAQIQKFYKENGYCHFTGHPPLVMDIGKFSLRDCAGGRVRMRTDTKAVTWEKAPTEKYVFPEHTDEEWALAIAGNWPPEKIPQKYLDRKESFNCWDNLKL